MTFWEVARVRRLASEIGGKGTIMVVMMKGAIETQILRRKFDSRQESPKSEKLCSKIWRLIMLHF